MEYVIIVAEVDTENHENSDGDKTKVDARVAKEGVDYITFNLSGDVDRQNELTKKLCNSLVDAGFLSFQIWCSY